jgi:hypothetical protein
MLNTSMDLEEATRTPTTQDDDARVEAPLVAREHEPVEYDGDNHIAVLTQMYGR